MGKSTRRSNLLPYCIIEAATSGNVEAINTIWKHYEGYIASLSMRKFYVECNNIYYCVDETLRRRLETKLIIKILDFKVV